MTMNMRHWAIIGATAVTVAAMATETSLESLTGVYAIFMAVIIGDKANSMIKER